MKLHQSELNQLDILQSYSYFSTKCPLCVLVPALHKRDHNVGRYQFNLSYKNAEASDVTVVYCWLLPVPFLTKVDGEIKSKA